MLGLNIKSVCVLADIGKRTLTEFEAGNRAVNNATLAKIAAFYLSRGVSFANNGPNSESVVFHDPDRNSHPIEDPPSDKFEYLDIFYIDQFIDNLSVMAYCCRRLEAQFSVSSPIMQLILRKSGLDQKGLSSEIGFTPSFTNAIVVGKKRIPVGRKESIGPYVDEVIDLSNALNLEIKIQKQISLIDKCVSQASVMLHDLRKCYLNSPS